MADAFAYLNAVVEVCPCANHCGCAYHLSCYDAGKAESKPGGLKPGAAQTGRKKGEIRKDGEVQDAFDKGTGIGDSISASILRQ